MLVKSSDSTRVLLAGSNAASLRALLPAAELLETFGIRTATMTLETGRPPAEWSQEICAVIVASADAALPAALAASAAVPVLRVPTADAARAGLALLQDAHDNLPSGPAAGVFATLAIGEAGAKNAALFVVSALALQDSRLHAAWKEYRARQTTAVLQHPLLAL